MAVRVLRKARSDLLEIGITVGRDNPTAALKLVEDIVLRFDVLESQPHMGVSRSDLSSRLRMFTCRGYLIFYRPVRGGIEIVRVINGVRNYRQLF